MAHHFTLPEQAKIVGALTPATDAAGRNGRFVSLKNAHKAYILAHIAQGNAATVAVSVQQAQDVSGTAAKAITTARIWVNADLSAGDTLVRQSDAASFTTDAGVKEKQVVIEIDPAALDVTNGFDCIRVVTGASNVANITEAQYLLAPLRYPSATPPSAIID